MPFKDVEDFPLILTHRPESRASPFAHRRGEYPLLGGNESAGRAGDRSRFEANRGRFEDVVRGGSCRLTSSAGLQARGNGRQKIESPMRPTL